MADPYLVYLDLNQGPIHVGYLWNHFRSGRESMSFEYSREWLHHPNRFSLDPVLQLSTGSFHTSFDRPLFGALDDSAPDRWGRILMRRYERRMAEREQRSPHTLREIDYLLMVDDEARQGAVRFKEKETGPFLTTYKERPIPPLISIGKLLQATNRLLNESDTEEDLRLLLAPGSSLGGARPKASVRDRDGSLAIAKFPRKDDEINVIAWEGVALSLAARAGIQVPTWRFEAVGKEQILLSKRFDRKGMIRIPYLSAMSALNARDNEPHSYLEIADIIREMSAAPEEDLEELWRRIVFNVSISNLDDHLRNHAFIYPSAQGWRLSPAFDLNPVPLDIKPKILTTSISDGDNSASLELAFEVARYFNLSPQRAKEIAGEVGSATSLWKAEAAKAKIKKGEIDRMSSAFAQ